MKTIFSIISNYKRDIIYILFILLLICSLSFSIRTCSNTRSKYKNNIIALKDTIKYYKGKNGNLVATKRAFESSLKDLKLLNEDLYNKLDQLKAKGHITSGVSFEGFIENPSNDTTYIIQRDTLYKGFNKNFDFNNDYRILEGNVSYNKDSLNLHIDKDIVKFDYTVALDDKNNIMINSSNPYVKFNEMTGFQIPRQKQKHWSLGPSVGFGYNPIENKPSFNVGVSLNYGIITF